GAAPTFLYTFIPTSSGSDLRPSDEPSAGDQGTEQQTPVQSQSGPLSGLKPIPRRSESGEVESTDTTLYRGRLNPWNVKSPSKCYTSSEYRELSKKVEILEGRLKLSRQRESRTAKLLDAIDKQKRQ
ncbi:eukaryotic translation initiation factor 3subunit G, partial [Striga asiatica]